ncbi:hypothetical protein MTR67_023856 [Solanum verrucosum]|uniref:Retrotransposon gag domain-containing protein n=1 Tax=Solanum verrucosum TaxID=315347 RepID=A0AAF0TS73_SOLVR|nr:hypothetical protein MTR67_023856 [Solanum verrucosum]
MDRIHDQFSRLEQGPMTVLEYEAWFHELSRHVTMILPPVEERGRCFVCGLRYHLRVDTEHLVSTGLSFIDVVDHARSMEHIHRESQEGSDNRARYLGVQLHNIMIAMLLTIGPESALDEGEGRFY